MAERGDVGAEALMIARTAKMQIDSHERLCAERYEQIKTNQKDAKIERRIMHEENTAKLALIGGRVDRLYNRAWAIAIAIVTAETSLLIGTVAWFMKHYMEMGMKP